MKVCQRWCKLDRGPLQAHCAWKCPLASWNMQLLWLDSVPAGFQSLHKHSPTMFSWKLTICGACPTVRHPPNCPWEGRLTLQFGPQIKGLESFCWGIRGLCSALNCVVQQQHSIFWGLMIAIFSTVCIISDRPRSSWVCWQMVKISKGVFN